MNIVERLKKFLSVNNIFFDNILWEDGWSRKHFDLLCLLNDCVVRIHVLEHLQLRFEILRLELDLTAFFFGTLLALQVSINCQLLVCI